MVSAIGVLITNEINCVLFKTLYKENKYAIFDAVKKPNKHTLLTDNLRALLTKSKPKNEQQNSKNVCVYKIPCECVRNYILAQQEDQN